MTIAQPELSLELGTDKTQLSVQRENIQFFNVDRDTVRIEITIFNQGDLLSPPTDLRLEVAPFGAFVPWQHVAFVNLPPIAPGESIDVSHDVVRPHIQPIGYFNNVPPQALITAVSPGDWERRDSARQNDLPPDFMDLLGRQNQHWAGNVNVFIGDKPVERHMSRALRIYPGRVNQAMFLVGSGNDAYAFEIKGLNPDWNATLFDPFDCITMRCDTVRCQPIPEGEWISTNGTQLVFVLIEPP